MWSLPALRPPAVLGLLLLAASWPLGAAEIGPEDDLRAAIAALGPGDELVLRGGTYALSSRFVITVVGTQSQPAVIRAKAGERPLIDQINTGQNIMEILGSQHLIVRGLAFTGGSHGIRLMDSDFITIEECEVYETGDVAISANSGGTYEGLKLLRNHIHHTNGTGEGMYLGCNSNGCRVANSLIEGNYIHHTNRPGVAQGDGIELKEGSYGNVIRDNVIHDTFYPGIITYSTVGNGPANIVEGNVIWNVADNSIQSAADAVIRNNIVLGSPIALQSHQAGSPSNIQVVHNTVIANGDGINVRNVVGSVLVANNAVYAQGGTAIRLISGNTSLVTVAGNVGVGGLAGGSGGFVQGNGIAADFVNGHFGGAPPIDLFPRPGSALIGAASASYATESDFNGNSRAGSNDAGAYRYSDGGNPGWQITTDFKPSDPGPVLPTSNAPMLTALPDANADGVPDLAIVRGEPSRVDVRGGADAALLGTVPYFDEPMVPLASAALPDSDGNGVPELVMLAERASDGRLIAEVRNVAGPAMRRQIYFSPDLDYVAMAILPVDISGNGVPELAVLGKDAGGRPWAQVKDTRSGSLVGRVYFDPAYSAFGFEVVEDVDGGGVVELALLGVDGAGRVRAQMKDAVSGQLAGLVYFDRDYPPSRATGLDLDGNGQVEALAVLGEDASGIVRVQVKEVAGATRLSTMRFESGYVVEELLAVPDVNGSGTPELAVVQADGPGQIRVQVKDALTGAPVRAFVLAAGGESWDAVVLGDVSGNGKAELAWLGEDAQGTSVLQVRDVATGTLISHTSLP